MTFDSAYQRDDLGRRVCRLCRVVGIGVGPCPIRGCPVTAQRDEDLERRIAWRFGLGRVIDKLIERDGPQCSYCRTEMDTDKHPRSGKPRATVDHVIPKVAGGTDDPANLVLACQPCNNKKADMSDSEFRALLAMEQAG